MSFYHNRHFRRKNKINKSKNNLHKQSPSANITDLNQTCKRTIFVINVLRLVACAYFHALKSRNIAKAWCDAEEHVQRWIELPIIIEPLQIEMAIISHESDGANSAARISTGEGSH
jgi:hypothetical protein